MYTKFIVVTDDDVDIRDWKDVIRAVNTTRMDPLRDTTLVGQTPIDYLDFSPRSAGWAGRWDDATHGGPPKPRASGASRSSWSRPSNSASRHSSNSCCRRSRTPQTSAEIPVNRGRGDYLRTA